jgi:hypothetical protein
LTARQDDPFVLVIIRATPSPGDRHCHPFLARRAGICAGLNDVDRQAWLADVLARISDYTITALATLLP